MNKTRPNDTAAVIVAAGRGRRAGGEIAKQWQALAGARVIDHTLSAFARAPSIGRMVLVLHPDDINAPFPGCDIVAGGATRAQSVRCGLNHLASDPPAKVLIHDVARPCISTAQIEQIINALADSPGAAPALPVTDALWTAHQGKVTGMQPRDGLYRAQTPQGFDFAAILAAHQQADPNDPDDVAVAMRAGIDVAIVEGSEDNLKITYPADFDRAERILERLDGHTPRQRI